MDVPEFELADLSLGPGACFPSGKPVTNGIGGEMYVDGADAEAEEQGSEESEESENGFDMDEDMEDEIIPPEPVLCFFCEETGSPGEILNHCSNRHACHLADWVKAHRFSTEEIIRLVNFIRKTKPEALSLRQMMTGGQIEACVQWKGDEWMIPVRTTDHGITSLLIWDWEEPDEPGEPFPCPQETASCLPKLRRGGWSGQGDATGMTRAAGDQFFRDDDDTCESDDVNARNNSYFDSYSGFAIHCEMLRDAVRTEAYQKAISAVVCDKTVLDLGCGTGVLSCFAASAGAKSVVAVDKADIIDYAHEIAMDNGLADKIRFIHADPDQGQLPIDKVQVIVSEWMGYFLLFEGMLDSVIKVRDTYLAPGGTIIPSYSSLYISGISDMDAWSSRVGFWDSAYGLSFSCLKRHSLQFPAVEEINPDNVITSRSLLRSWDLLKCGVDETEFEVEVELVPNRSCVMTALIGFFDVGYIAPSGEAKVMLCTSPDEPVTHWAQSVFYLEKPFTVSQNVVVMLKMLIRKCRNDHRGLVVDVGLRTTPLGGSMISAKQSFIL